MRFCKKWLNTAPLRFKVPIGAWLALLCTCLTVPVAWADNENTLYIKSANLLVREYTLWLEADLEVDLDHVLQEALYKGVELSFLYEFQLIKPREYWFDDEIITKRKPVTLSYHALTKQFLVQKNQQQMAFDTLDQAMRALVNIRDWRIAPLQVIEKNETYQAAIKVHLDPSKLPKALQFDVLGEDEWELSSPVFTWWFKDNTK